MYRDIQRVLIDQGTIAARVRAMGQELATDLDRDLREQVQNGDKPGQIVLIPILTGAIVFLADLIRQMPLKMSIDVVAVSSYPGKSVQSKGASIKSELPKNLKDKHVVIVDDILDSGQTISIVRSLISELQPASLRTCVLLDKKCVRAHQGDAAIQADYFGFDIPDEFVVGYGLDYNGYYRNYPEIAALRDDAR